MIYKYEYKDNDERQALIEKNKTLFLIEEQNITEGNFLVFCDTQPVQQQVQVIVKEDDLEELKQKQTLMQKAIDDLILGGVL